MNPKVRLIIVILGFCLLGLFMILYFTEKNRNNKSEFIGSDVATGIVNAPEPATLLESNAGNAEAAPAGSYLFCVRLDGRQNGHLPALIGGGPSAYGNGQPGGYNWGLMPNATGAEDFGILSDGTVFCKVSYLQANGMVQFAEYIGAPAWVPIQMTEATVGGQAALTYKIPNF